MNRRRSKRFFLRRGRQCPSKPVEPVGSTNDSANDLRIVALEPRLVLNATAELNPLGQLLVFGSSDADVVQLQIETDGDLSLRDGSGNAIPIEFHPEGPGNETNPLDRAAVNEIRFEMGEGDDVLNLQLPRGIDVSVLPSGATDQVELDFGEFDSAIFASSSSIEVDAELIRLLPSLGSVSIADASVHLDGQLQLGNPASWSQIDITRGSLDLDGTFLISGDVAIVGEGSLDFSDAIGTATAPGYGLSIDLGTQASNRFLLGGTDNSGGANLNDVTVHSAGDFILGPSSLELDGDLSVLQVTEATVLASDVSANSVTILSDGDIEIQNRIEALNGGVTLNSGGVLKLSGQIDTTAMSTTGTIELTGSTVQLSDAELLTSGSLVQISGPVTVDGNVVLDTGDGQVSTVGGDVRFLNAIVGADGVGDSLRIDARSAGLGGSVTLQGAVGSSSSLPLLSDINGLRVDAQTIELNAVSVRSGDILLGADEIRLTAGDVRTLIAGDIVFDGDLLLPTGDTSVTSAGRVQFTSPVFGQVGSRDLDVVAGSTVSFADEVSLIESLRVTSANQVSFQGPVILSGDLDVTSDQIHLLASVDTTAGGLDGQIRLSGETEILVGGGSVLMVGQATIAMDGGGGIIDTSGSTLHSSANTTAMVFRNASQLTFGNLNASSGQVVMGVDQDLTGPTTQSANSIMLIDRLQVSSSSSLDLSNQANDFRLLEQVAIDGALKLRDAVDDLSIMSVTTSGFDATLTAAGAIVLSHQAIDATGATVRLTAGQGIIDGDGTAAANLQADKIYLQATHVGTDLNPLDCMVTSELNVDTSSADGDIVVANEFGDLMLGQILAGAGDVTLLAADDVLNVAANSLIVSDDLSITAGNALADGAYSIDLATNVNDLEASVEGPNRGDIRILEQDSIRLASSDHFADEIVRTSNGQVEVFAEDDIHVVNRIQTAGGGVKLVSSGSLEVMGEIDASAAMTQGAILLQTVGVASGDLLLADSSSVLSADQVTLFSEAGSVALDGTLDSNLLSVVVAGELTDGASGSVTVAELATLSAANITLGDSAGITTNFGSLIFNSTGAVALSEDSSMLVDGPSTAGDGLALSSAGDMQSDGTVDVAGDTALSATGTMEVNAKLTGSGEIGLSATNDITVNAEIDPT
ncbi:MAG: hypothetical protein P8L85_08855, partial [Rubripirellula sp.]|nr:hypothetical protein [Rubripirellula sp.]